MFRQSRSCLATHKCLLHMWHFCELQAIWRFFTVKWNISSSNKMLNRPVIFICIKYCAFFLCCLITLSLHSCPVVAPLMQVLFRNEYQSSILLGSTFSSGPLSCSLAMRSMLDIDHILSGTRNLICDKDKFLLDLLLIPFEIPAYCCTPLLSSAIKVYIFSTWQQLSLKSLKKD